MKIYQVGGSVRDEILGLKPKDIDYAVESPDGFKAMEDWVTATHQKVFLVTPQYYTIRALYTPGDVRDYVMCRKEGPYKDGRRPESVEPGTIYDDLARRDFTFNAIAKDQAGNLIDPHNGVEDLRGLILRCVGSAEERFTEDTLRIVRAVRFIQKLGVYPEAETHKALGKNWSEQMAALDSNRIRDELEKMFRLDTVRAMDVIRGFLRREVAEVIFSKVWLKPTMEAR